MIPKSVHLNYMSKYEEEPLAHIYAQAFWHDDAFIVANTESLCRLANAIVEAIASKSGEGKAELICNDGEGYTLKIIRADDEDTWDKLAVPYTASDAMEDNLEAIHPTILDERISQKDCD